MSQSAPSTPKPKRAAPPTGLTDSPGTWRHPRLGEIHQRRSASTFSDKNALQIAYNIAALVALWLAQSFAKSYLRTTFVSRDLQTYGYYGYCILQCIPCFNIGLALLPLVRRTDDLADIPLSDEQRQLLGLPPSSVPATPQTAVQTPPRYVRTPSFAGSVGSRGSAPNSPASTYSSPLLGYGGGTTSGNSPWSTSMGSGLNLSSYSPQGSSNPFQSSVHGGNGSPLQSRGISSAVGGLSPSSFPGRASMDSTSPLGASTTSLFPDLAPSPSGKRTSVGLNNKWLYERGRRNSSSRV